MYKIKPSLLDSYRIFKLEIFDKSLEDMIKQIKGEDEPSDAMSFGSEVHKYFELGECDLQPEEINQLQIISSKIPQGINELKFRQEYNGILFSVVIDRIAGNEVHEFKTSKSFKGVDFYSESLQWQIYSMLTNCDKFTYHVLTYNDVRPYKIKYHEPFSFYPYVGMTKNIFDWVYEFIDFCEYHNLIEYIKGE